MPDISPCHGNQTEHQTERQEDTAANMDYRDFPYADILDLPHHVSAAHPRMPQAERAAQFAPFAALTGYGDAVQESARLTSQRIDLDEDAREELNHTLQLLSAQLQAQGFSQQIRVTFFVPDIKKAGGSYVSKDGVIRKLPSDIRAIVLETASGSRRTIPLEDILRIQLL